MADISINWADLGKVAEVAGAFALGIALVFTVGVLAMSRWEAARETATDGSAQQTRANPIGAVVAGACFLACLAGAAYGIYLIVPQWGG